jgi:A/G-specific adenine glycosylase
VVAEYGGAFPSDPALLAELPGIGRSTAAAIAAFSAGRRAAIMDGNVKRVFARVFGIDTYPGERKTEEAMWARAEALAPAEGIEAYTQGLMDMGATLCTRSSPSCERCPMQARCVAFATGRTAELPVRKPKKATPEKRPASGIWGGLLSLPELAGHVAGADTPEDGAVAAAVHAFGPMESLERLLPVVHVFTHYKLHIHPLLVTLASRAALAGEGRYLWLDAAAIPDAALPAPIKKLLLDLLGERAQARMF